MSRMAADRRRAMLLALGPAGAHGLSARELLAKVAGKTDQVKGAAVWLRERGLVVSVGYAAGHRYVLPEFGAEALALQDQRRLSARLKKNAARAARLSQQRCATRGLDAAAAAEADTSPFVHHLVQALACAPLRKRGPASVWELAKVPAE